MSEEHPNPPPHDNSSSPGSSTGIYHSCPLNTSDIGSAIQYDTIPTYSFNPFDNGSAIQDDTIPTYSFNPNNIDPFNNHQGYPNNQFNLQNLNDANSFIDDSSDDYYHDFALDERQVL